MQSKEEQLFIELIKAKEKKESYKNIDWQKFIELCYYHRVNSFIYQKLDKKIVPKKELEKMQENNRQTALINLFLNKEMVSFFGELKKRKINVIALKGMALNYVLYSKEFSRVSSDIDFLIRKKNYFEIKEVLEKKGFASSSYGMVNGGPFTQHYPGMRKKINGITCLFEPHKTLFFPVNLFSIDLEEIWRDSQEINGISIPGNEDTIIIAVLSAIYQHDFHGIFESLLDVKNMLSKEINYKKLREKTIKYNLVEPMVYFNELFRELFEKEMQGIKELEKNADKKKLAYLRKNPLQKIIKIKTPFSAKLERIKSRFYWTKGIKQKIKAFFFVLVLPCIWLIKNTVLPEAKKK